MKISIIICHFRIVLINLKILPQSLLEVPGTSQQVIGPSAYLQEHLGLAALFLDLKY